MSHTNPTPTELQEVLDTTLDNDSLTAHIEASRYEVEDIAESDASIGDDRLKQIHLYLAAHYATSQDQRASSQSGESRSISYADDNADYMMLASRLDPTGSLATSQLPSATIDVPDAKGLDN